MNTSFSSSARGTQKFTKSCTPATALWSFKNSHSQLQRLDQEKGQSVGGEEEEEVTRPADLDIRRRNQPAKEENEHKQMEREQVVKGREKEKEQNLEREREQEREREREFEREKERGREKQKERGREKKSAREGEKEKEREKEKEKEREKESVRQIGANSEEQQEEVTEKERKREERNQMEAVKREEDRKLRDEEMARVQLVCMSIFVCNKRRESMKETSIYVCHENEQETSIYERDEYL